MRRIIVKMFERASIQVISIFVFASFLMLWRLVQKIRLQLHRGQIKRDHGCLEAPAFPQKDRLFGLGMALEDLRAHKEHRRTSTFTKNFEAYGYTYTNRTMGRRFIVTAKPANIQSIYSTDFDSWGIEPFRLFAFEPFVGKGVVNTDGTRWKHSRAMIRPLFTKSR